MRQIMSEFYVLNANHVKVSSWNWVAFTPPKNILTFTEIFTYFYDLQ